MADGAHLRRGALGAAVALAGGALLAALHVELLLAAEGRFGKGDGHAGADALAPLGCVGVAPLGAAKAAAEEAAENVAQIAEVEARRAVAPSGAACARPVAGVNAREAELVVPGLLVGIGQHLVGLVDLLEFLLGLLVAGVHVRVVLAGQLFICFFDLILRRALADAEDLVIISFFLSHKLTSHSIGNSGTWECTVIHILVGTTEPAFARPFHMNVVGFSGNSHHHYVGKEAPQRQSMAQQQKRNGKY